MSPTLLELALVIVILVIAWQLGIALAPSVLRLLGSLRREVDEAAEAAASDSERDSTRS